MRHAKIKKIVLLLGFFLSVAWCGANERNVTDGNSHIQIKQSHVQGIPKGSTIEASINGHTLVVTFSENIGQVAVEVTTNAGVPVEGISAITPTGVMFYIPLAGDYIVTFTLPNGDEYYGEFSITD